MAQVDVADVPASSASAAGDAAAGDGTTAGEQPAVGSLFPKYPPTWPPELPKIASIRAYGTGCPVGSTNVSSSADGTMLFFTFSKFEAAVDKNQSVAIKDCRLAITLTSQQSLSYTVEELGADGYAFTQAGQQAQLSIQHSFKGVERPGEEALGALEGPVDDWFELQKVTDPASRIWSPCGTQSELGLYAQLRLENGEPRDEGYINLAVPAGDGGWISVRLGWRPCS